MQNHQNAMVYRIGVSTSRICGMLACWEEVVVSRVSRVNVRVCHNSGTLHSLAMTNFVSLLSKELPCWMQTDKFLAILYYTAKTFV